MATTVRLMSAPPTSVWEVLADGWLYPSWVVGASRMREVSPDWPRVGAALHHSVGAWPALVDDTTEVVRCEPEHELALRARGWPLGEASIVITLRRSDAGTVVQLEEKPVSGPGRLIPTPLSDPMIGWRNVETLRRLAFIAERRTRTPTPTKGG